MDDETTEATPGAVDDVAKQVLDTMLGYLGFVVEVEVEDRSGEKCLQVHTGDAELLIGKGGDRLDDIQYLLNRILQKQVPDAPRVRVDVEHYRTMREDKLLAEVQGHAERVRATGKPVKLAPMNGYYRRLVHNAYADDPELETWSPNDRSRVKRITLRRKRQG